MHREEIQQGGAAVAQVDDAFGYAMREVATALRRRRVGFILVVLLSAAGAGVGLFFEHRAMAPSSCARLIGPVDELSKLSGRSLRLGYGFDIKGGTCNQEVEDATRVTAYVVQVEVRIGDYDAERQRREAQKFAEVQTVPTELGDALLFVAGDAPRPSPDEIAANAVRQVGRVRDPMGAALAALPPSHHIAIMQHYNELVIVSLERKSFTPEQARNYAIAVAQRVVQPAR